MKASHAFFFPLITASGEVVKQCVLLHYEIEEFDDKSSYPFVKYRSDNGYMNQKTLTKILCDVFIPHVYEVRKVIERNKHVVLIVSGYICR